jgi:hypothetical protein
MMRTHMFNHLARRWLPAVLCLSLASTATPQTLPIELRADVPQDMKTGDAADSTLHFRARVAVARFVVRIWADRDCGVEILSETREATFDDVPANGVRDVRLRVKLTAPAFGYVSVQYCIPDGDREACQTRAVVYGKP